MITILAKSSSDVPYTVEFSLENGKLSARCNCKAGIFGKLCKHKTELLAGDAARLYDPHEGDKLQELQAIVARAPGLVTIASEIAESERTIRNEQAKLKKIKKGFAEQLKDGIEVKEA